MTPLRHRRDALAIAALVIPLGGSGCGLFGPSCLERQERGSGTTVSGTVGAGQTVVHRIAYDTRGSQNDVTIDWQGLGMPNGPRVRSYATRTACSDFPPPPAANNADCAVLASAGFVDGQVARSLIITNGRGNPDVLGSPAEYKLWIVGDPTQAAAYAVTTTWFYGPDC
jgi:hypothetical protein